jgi:hypothetical protein
MENRRIVVLCPPYYKTGGTELLHQLVCKINGFSQIKALICYVGVDWKIEVLPTPPSFMKYVEDNTIIIDEIISEDILIFPETLTKISYDFKNNYKILWWLSVDNFYNSIGYKKKPIIKNLLKKMLSRPPFNIINDVFKGDLFELHLVQSEYALLHLMSHKIEKKILPLSDYLGLNFGKIEYDPKGRKNRILYNPLKSSKFIENLVNTTDFEWVKLEKLSNEELINQYQISKIYLDLGNHPGKDRIPREAAIFGCVVITNMKGSAENNIDVQIDSEFKVKENNSPEFVQRLQEVLYNYDSYYEKQDNYRKKIEQEEAIFNQEVAQFVNFLIQHVQK